MFQPFKRKVRIVLRTQNVYLPADTSKFLDLDAQVEKIQDEYNRILIAINPQLGSKTNRDYISRQLGRMDGLVDAVQILTGTDCIVLGFQMEKKAYENLRRVNASVPIAA